MLNLLKIDLNQFMGGRYFILLYIVSKNRYKVTFIALTDSGANSFVFINTSYAINIIKFLNLKT
jgi:hypothetical protein